MDRKAWIVLALCIVGLAVNWHFMGKNRKAFDEAQRKELAEKAAKEKANPGPIKVEEGDPEGTPDQPAPVPVAEEQLIELTTKEAIFTFTTFGGGIKYARMIEQLAVGDVDKLVRLNRFGPEPVGRLTSGPNAYFDIIYEHKADLQTSRSVTFVGSTEDGLEVTKSWTLVDDS